MDRERAEERNKFISEIKTKEDFINQMRREKDEIYREVML